MATSSKKTVTAPASRTTPVKKPVAKKVVVATSAIKATTKKVVVAPAKKMSVPKTEKPASKQAETTKISTQKRVKKNTVTPEKRYHMIATAAYFRAEQRGFACGCAKEDWIHGEAQIDTMLNA